MIQKERYSAEIDARIAKFGETLKEIKTKRELRNETRPELERISKKGSGFRSRLATAKKRSIHVVCEHFLALRNADMGT